MICLAATNPESSRMNEIFQQVHSLIEIFSWPLWCDQKGGGNRIAVGSATHVHRRLLGLDAGRAFFKNSMDVEWRGR